MKRATQIITGDALEILRSLPERKFQCCVTSPPYFSLRDYEVNGQIGNETTPQEYIDKLVDVFSEVNRVLRDDGTLWLNIGDTYANDGKWGGSSGGKHVKALHGKTGIGRNKTISSLAAKNLMGIPHRVAFSLQENGWIFRDTIIWHKPNPMPQSVKDRCTNAYEYVFMFAKKPRYYYGFDEMQEPATYAGQSRGGSRNRYEQNGPNNYGLNHKKYDTRNMRNVWTIQPDVCPGKEHFAVFPEELTRRCIVAGCPEDGIVLDPFVGSGTTAVVAMKHHRHCVGIELNPRYAAIAETRITQNVDLFTPN